MIFQIIWKHQNPPDCSKAKFLIMSAYRSGMWSDDVSCMFDLPAYSHYICQAIQWCDRRWLTLKLVSSFDKNNPYYAHGWLILHFVSYFSEIRIHQNTKIGTVKNAQNLSSLIFLMRNGSFQLIHITCKHSEDWYWETTVGFGSSLHVEASILSTAMSMGRVLIR